MSESRLKTLKEELYEKLREIQAVAVETNTPFYFSVRNSTYEVFLPDHEDEEMVEFLEAEYDIQPGDWVASSDRC